MKEYNLSQFGNFFRATELSLIHKLSQIAKNNKAKIYLTGGFLRDRLINALNNQDSIALDFDFVVEGMKATSLAQIIAETVSGNFVLLDDEFDTARVILKDSLQLDLAGPKTDDNTLNSRQADALKRDFSINAIIWDPDRPDLLIDFTNGVDDLKEKRLRVIDDTAFTDDPLRMLRAFRLSCQLGFHITPETIELIKLHALKINAVAIERINHEMFLIMNYFDSHKTIKKLADTGLLELIYPDLKSTRTVPANSYHHLNLFDHSLETYRQVEVNFASLEKYYQNRLLEPLTYNLSHLASTKLAGLLHDIGKPATWVIQENGRHSFYKHDSLGAKMVNEMGIEQKWPNHLIKYLVNLVKWHLRPGSLYANDAEPSQKAINRFYTSVGDHTPGLILLSLADLGATCGEGFKEEARGELRENLHRLLNGYSAFTEKQKYLRPLLDGNAIIGLLSIEPGPIVGSLISELKEAQTNGEILKVSEAKAFIEDLYKKKYSSQPN